MGRDTGLTTIQKAARRYEEDSDAMSGVESTNQEARDEDLSADSRPAQSGQTCQYAVFARKTRSFLLT